MIGKIIQPELEAFIATRDFGGLQAVFKEMLVPDIAEVIDDIRPNDRALLFRLLPKQMAMETFENLEVRHPAGAPLGTRKERSDLASE